MNKKSLNNFYASDNSSQLFDPGTFDQEEKIRNFGKSFEDKTGESIDVKDKEKIDGLKKETEGSLEKKAAEFGLSKDDLINMDKDFCILEDKLEKSNFVTKEEEELEQFRKELDQTIKEKASKAGISINEAVSTDGKLKRATKDFISKKESLKLEREALCNDWILNGSEEIRKRIKEDARGEGLSEKCLSEIADMIEKSDFEKGIKEKARKLGITEKILYKFSSLDVGNLYSDDLYSDLGSNLKSYIIFRDNLRDDLNQIGLKKKESSPRITKFIEKHKKAVGFGQLALYLSAFGAPALKEWAEEHATVDIYGVKVSLKDLQDNPELIKKIDRAHGLNSPIDIKAVYEPLGSFEAGGGVKFSFQTHDEVKDGKTDRFIYFSDILGPSDGIDKMNEELTNIGISLVAEKKYSIDDFINKKDQIAKIMSKNLGVPEEEIGKYLNEFLEPSVSVSDISIVELEDFKIDQNLKNPEDMLKLQQKKEEVYTKYNVYSENGFKIPENWLKAEKELEQWWKENGNAGKSFDNALAEEKKNFDNSPEVKLKHLKYQEKETETFKNAEKFKELTLKSLSDAGYSIPELKKIAEKNPEKVIKIMTEVIGKNVNYDWLEYLNITVGSVISELIGKDFQIDYYYFMNKKHDEGIPKATMESGKGVCHDYGITFVAMKHILEKEGVPNLDKFVSFWTISNKEGHLWNGFATVDSEGKLIISYADPTWSDVDEKKLNAVDNEHYYTLKKEIVDEQHQKALEKIQEYNEFVRQEKIKEIITTYDPKLHKREQRIEGNKKLREKEKDIEPLREERNKNVREHLKLIRDKLKKIYAKKDSGNE